MESKDLEYWHMLPREVKEHKEFLVAVQELIDNQEDSLPAFDATVDKHFWELA